MKQDTPRISNGLHSLVLYRLLSWLAKWVAHTPAYDEVESKFEETVLWAISLLIHENSCEWNDVHS